MKKINPKIVKLLVEGNRNLRGTTVNGTNCGAVLKQMAKEYQNSVERSSSIKNDFNQKNRRSNNTSQFL